MVLLCACSSAGTSQTQDAADTVLRHDAGASEPLAPDTSTGSDASDRPACVYQNYTEAEYNGFADGGTLGNLPCGGCAPATRSCSPNGSDPGRRFTCWAQYLYDMPPAPGTGCQAIGVQVNGVDPTIWQVCCF